MSYCSPSALTGSWQDTVVPRPAGLCTENVPMPSARLLGARRQYLDLALPHPGAEHSQLAVAGINGSRPQPLQQGAGGGFG